MVIDIEVNNKIIKAKKGETILAALRRNGLHVPTLCSMKDLPPTGACRLCAVEVEGKDELIPSCAYPVNGWMRIKTHSPRVITARKTIVELLLSNHPDDCLYCIRNGSCELQKLAEELNVHDRRFYGNKKKQKIDNSSLSIVRDPDKCILCGRCVRYCDEIMGISAIEFIKRGTNATIGPEFNKAINASACISCGQCINSCPTGALHEKTYHNKIRTALHNTDKHVIAITDSALNISIGEEFGFKPGRNIGNTINAALRIIGFNAIFDAAFGADLYVNELVTALKSRKENHIEFPLLSSHCPSWIKHSENVAPDLQEHIATALPPQQALGKIIKTYYAKKMKLDPDNIFIVSINSCLSKKDEAGKKAYLSSGITNIDASITTRELAGFIKLHGVEIEHIEEELTDLPFGMASSAGRMLPLSGGLTESLIRSMFLDAKDRELRPARITKLRNTKTVKEYTFKHENKSYKFLAINGIKEAMEILEELKLGIRKADFVEILTCKNGCINGGGQPLRRPDDNIKARRKAIYELDNKGSIKVADKNPELIELYDRYLGKANSKQRIETLHINSKQ